jgi:hypothetical protein
MNTTATNLTFLKGFDQKSKNEKKRVEKEEEL